MGDVNKVRGAHAKHAKNVAERTDTVVAEETKKAAESSLDDVRAEASDAFHAKPKPASTSADTTAPIPSTPSAQQGASRLPAVAPEVANAKTAPIQRVSEDTAPVVGAPIKEAASNDGFGDFTFDSAAAEGASDSASAAADLQAPQAENPFAGGALVLANDGAEDALEPISAEDMGFDMGKPKKSHKVLKRLGIAVGSLVGLAAAVYVGGALAFNNWFLPISTLFGEDVSLKSSEEVAAMIDGVVGDYKLTVRGPEFTYSTDANKAGITVDSEKIVREMHEGLGMWNWLVTILEPSHELDNYIVIDYDRNAVARDVAQAVEQFNETGTDPVDAHLEYNAEQHKFEVIPEEFGTKYEAKAIDEVIDKAINTFAASARLNNDQLVQPLVFSTDKKLNDDVTAANKLVNVDISLKLGGYEAGHINADELHNYVVFDPVEAPRIDTERLNAWASWFAWSLNTVESERTYYRLGDNKLITVSGGAYGWGISSPDQVYNDIMAAINAGGTQEVNIECWQTASAWNGPGQQDWSNRYIDVDLSEQYVRFFNENGVIIWETSCISGAPDGMHDTPTGVWYVTRKESPSKLIGWENGKKIYESYVRYWMPFVGNEIGLHDADWQPSFGGYMYASGYGSHGCVNLPVYMAEELYWIVEINDPVIVHW